MFTKLKPLLEPILNILTKPFLRVHPIFFSLLSFLVPTMSGVALANRMPFVAAILFLGNIFDSFDGHIARKTGKTSKFGALLDTTLDRVVESVIFFGAAIGGYVSMEIAFAAMFFSIMVSFVKSAATALLSESNVGTNALSVGIGQRGDRLFILFIGMLAADYSFKGYNALEIATIFIVITAFITVVWRMVKAYKLFK